MKLTDLILSDLERHFHYNCKQGISPKASQIWICFVHPRCIPITLYRLSHWSLSYGLPGRIAAKFLTWLNFFLFGIEIDSRCTIGPGCYLPHPNGTVIGAHSIGSGALIYQQVTLGARTPRVDQGGRPKIGNNVILGAGAKVLGEIIVGDDSIVGPNSVVLESLPARVTALGVPAVIIKTKESK